VSDPQYPTGGQPATPSSDATPPPWAQPAQQPQLTTPGWAQPPVTPPGAPPSAPGWAQPPAAPTWGQPPAQPSAQPAPGSWSTTPQPPAQPGWTQPPAQPAGWSQPPAQAGWSQPPAQQAGWSQPQSQPGYNQGWGGQGTMTAPYIKPGHYMLRGLIAGLFLLAMGLLTILVAAAFITGGALLGGVVGDALRQAGVSVDELGGSGSTQVVRDATNLFTGALVVLGVIIGLFGLFEAFGGLGTLLRRGWGRVLGIITTIMAVLPVTFVSLGSLSVARNLDTTGIDTSSVGNSGIVAVAIIIAIVVLYWFSLFALITGGAHFRRR
jgi:hypothetical protein